MPAQPPPTLPELDALVMESLKQVVQRGDRLSESTVREAFSAIGLELVAFDEKTGDVRFNARVSLSRTVDADMLAAR